MSSGVLKGPVLGPCLFLLYINYLPLRVSSPSRLFADDTILYRFIACAQDQIVLQQDPKHLEEWESGWGLSFHPEKCSHLLLTRSQKNSNPNYTLHGQTLETVSSSKYLGLAIQRNLVWDRHINSTCTKANKTLGFLRRSLKIGSRKVKERAQKAMIRPILQYAPSVWDPNSRNSISKIEMV